ncbi:hypothetical protein EV368DRAFT_66201 [Lentinula lateritia]|nr:hypothetical protein EV368DRAFT_66201 [Lentinula lateritia]
MDLGVVTSGPITHEFSAVVIAGFGNEESLPITLIPSCPRPRHLHPPVDDDIMFSQDPSLDALRRYYMVIVVGLHRGWLLLHHFHRGVQAQGDQCLSVAATRKARVMRGSSDVRNRMTQKRRRRPETKNVAGPAERVLFTRVTIAERKTTKFPIMQTHDTLRRLRVIEICAFGASHPRVYRCLFVYLGHPRRGTLVKDDHHPWILEL